MVFNMYLRSFRGDSLANLIELSCRPRFTSGYHKNRLLECLLNSSPALTDRLQVSRQILRDLLGPLRRLLISGTLQNPLGLREFPWGHPGTTGIPRDTMHEKDFSE